MKRISPLLGLLLLSGALAGCAPSAEVEIEAGELVIAVSADGQVSGFKTGSLDLLPPEGGAALLSLRVAGEYLTPESASFTPGDSVLSLAYTDGLEAEIRVSQKQSHATFEVVSLSDTSRVELVLWGPYPTILDEVIGETVGVVQGQGVAVGLQALNPRTQGGYPWNENDAMPQLDIFESGDFSDLSELGKRYVLYRVEAAKPDSFGSTLQAYTRNRSRSRVIPNLGYEEYRAPSFDDGGVVGSKIALFGSQALDALDTIGLIEVAEGLPHPMLDGVWAKKAPRAAQAYVIMPFGENTLDRALDVVERAGMQYLYHPDPFSSWGQFTLRSDDFPHGVDGMRDIVYRAEARDIRIGGHTLSNFIQPHDAYVSPAPDPRLAKVGSERLTSAVDARQSSIPVSDGALFVAGQKSTLRTLMIGSELVQYASVSEGPPWQLLDVTRGAFDTIASGHDADAEISLLADHGYRVFLTDPELTVEMAQNLAAVFEESGMKHVSFDGLEGNRSTGMGNYGEVLFSQAWFDALSEDAQQDLIVTASRTSHYFWHLYTRMNWGEPWYAGFRESQTEYRMKNQKYFRRNFMPGMLGWFSMRAETSVEDIEWMLARSAAYDAGYAFYTNAEVLDQNGRALEILDLLATWEEARLSGAFSTEQKARMEDVSGEFHLEATGSDSWTLYPISTFRYTYQARERQPGEPADESFLIEHPGSDSGIAFSVAATDGDVRDLVLTLGGENEITLPVGLREGQVLYYDGGETARIYSPSWNVVGRVPVDSDMLTLAAGTHRFGIRTSASPATAKVEVRVTGEGEAVESATSSGDSE